MYFSPTAAPPAGVLISYSRIGCPKILAKSLKFTTQGCWGAGSGAGVLARLLGCWLGCPGARSGARVPARVPGCPLGFPGSRLLSFEFWLSGEGRGGTQRRFSSFGSREKRAEVHNDVFQILALRRSPRRYTMTFFEFGLVSFSSYRLARIVELVSFSSYRVARIVYLV